MSNTNTPLYRQQALLHAAQRSFGGVMIKQPLTLIAISFLVLLITVVIIVFLKNGEYARKVTVSGYLKSDLGISRVYPNSKGIVERLLVEDGELVQKGQVLIEVKASFTLANGDEAHGLVLKELLAQKERIYTGMRRSKDKHAHDYSWQKTQLRLLNKEQKQIQTMLGLQKSRSQVAEQQLMAVEALKKNGHISENQLFQNQAAYLAEQKEFALILQRSTRIDVEIKTAEHQLRTMPGNLKDKLEQLWQQSSELSQRVTEVQGRAEYLVKAPITGRITAINSREGEPLIADRPILSIVPLNAQLFAWLQVPSRAAGFTREQQIVRLMFDSFPYQQFGTQTGTIVSISKIAQSPFGITGRALATEPVYIAKVKLDKPTITAFGQEVALQVDMLLSADIIQARRSIFDWMAEPLYTLRGRVH